MEVAIISDTHLGPGARGIPEKCRTVLEESDAIVHAGDFSTRLTYDELAIIGPPVHAVHGNVDDADLLSLLPTQTTVQLEGIVVGLVHDSGKSIGRIDRLRGMFPQANAVIFGHSHQPLHQTSDGFEIFNPGSPTQRRAAPRHTMGQLTVKGTDFDFRLIDLD